jgi:hypothetical protein
VSRLALAVGLALALVAGGSASAEVVAPRIHDGMLALAPNGKPAVAFVRRTALEISTRVSAHRWRTTRVASVSAGSKVVAFAVGAAGPVALVQSADDRTLLLVRRVVPGWRAVQVVGTLPAGVSLGWPGLALDRGGQASIAYTRWHQETRKSTLYLVRADPRGRLHPQRLTLEGFPKSFVAPPAVPVFARGSLHVIESYGFDGAVGTIEWAPRRKTWVGQFIDGGVGDFPVGPLLAAVDPRGTVYAAWTEALLGTGDLPVTLAVHGQSISSDVVLNRALTTGLVAAASGPEVAANEWRSADELGLPGDDLLWAGEISGHGRRVELDGWLAGLASSPRGARDVLLATPAGLSWFRSPRSLGIRSVVDAAEQPDGSVLVSGRIRGAGRGKVTIYRERPGYARRAIGSVQLGTDGSFSLSDRPPARPLVYRAVYTDRATGIPYAALLRTPVG